MLRAGTVEGGVLARLFDRGHGHVLPDTGRATPTEADAIEAHVVQRVAELLSGAQGAIRGLSLAKSAQLPRREDAADAQPRIVPHTFAAKPALVVQHDVEKIVWADAARAGPFQCADGRYSGLRSPRERGGYDTRHEYAREVNHA